MRRTNNIFYQQDYASPDYDFSQYIHKIPILGIEITGRFLFKFETSLLKPSFSLSI